MSRYGLTIDLGSLFLRFTPCNVLHVPHIFPQLNPCIWGSQPGLRSPPSITADTNLTAIKYFNNTFRHLGQMAQWTVMLQMFNPTFK